MDESEIKSLLARRSSVLEAVEKRRSTRSFVQGQEGEIPEEVLDHLIYVATLAPSACHAQPGRYVKALGLEIRKLEEASAFPQRWVYSAPALIIACSVDPYADADTLFRAHHQLKDGSLTKTNVKQIRAGIAKPEVRRDIISDDMGYAIQNMALRATEMGLGTCVVRLYHESAIRTALDIPDMYNIELAFCVGKPAKDPTPINRLSIDEVII